MAPNAHSRLGASKAARWMACPGSVAACEGLPDSSSAYADEGTAAHQHVEDALAVVRVAQQRREHFAPV